MADVECAAGLSAGGPGAGTRRCAAKGLAPGRTAEPRHRAVASMGGDENNPHLAASKGHGLTRRRRERGTAVSHWPGPVCSVCLPVPEHGSPAGTRALGVGRASAPFEEPRRTHLCVLDHHGGGTELAIFGAHGGKAIHRHQPAPLTRRPAESEGRSRIGHRKGSYVPPTWGRRAESEADVARLARAV